MAKARVFTSQEEAERHQAMAEQVNAIATERVNKLKEAASARPNGEVGRPGPEVLAAVASGLKSMRRDLLLSLKEKGSTKPYIQTAIDRVTADLEPAAGADVPSGDVPVEDDVPF